MPTTKGKQKEVRTYKVTATFEVKAKNWDDFGTQYPKKFPLYTGDIEVTSVVEVK